MSTTCPQCGQPSADGKAQEIKAWNGKRIRRLFIFIVSGLAIAFGLIMLIGGIGLAFSTNVPGIFWVYLVMMLLFAGPGAWSLWSYFKEPKLTRSTQRCAHCQKEWSSLQPLNYEASECPHCHEAVVVSLSARADADSGEEVNVIKNLGGALIMGPLGLLLIWMGIGAWGQMGTAAIMIVAGISLIGYAFRALWVFFVATRATLVKYHCPACNQNWSTLDGKPVEAPPQPQAG